MYVIVNETTGAMACGHTIRDIGDELRTWEKYGYKWSMFKNGQEMDESAVWRTVCDEMFGDVVVYV